MQSKSELLQLLNKYHASYHNETNRLQPILEFIRVFEGDLLFSRKNFTGHVTGSSYILNSSKRALLLLKHKSLNRWLQPGGHVEASDISMLDAALREAVEETGIPPEHLIPVSGDIFDVDSHPIPENTIKGEPAHTHHDISFLFTCDINHTIKIDAGESSDGEWVGLSRLSDQSRFDTVLKKIHKAIR